MRKNLKVFHQVHKLFYYFDKIKLFRYVGNKMNKIILKKNIYKYSYMNEFLEI